MADERQRVMDREIVDVEFDLAEAPPTHAMATRTETGVAPAAGPVAEDGFDFARGGEIADAMAGLPAFDVAMRPEMAAVQDVMSNEDAMLLAGRWAGRAVPGGEIDPTMIEGPRQLRIADMRELREPGVPALLRPEEGAVVPFEERPPRWLKVYNLPGYMQNGIRNLGRRIMSSFPCFEYQVRRATGKGEDPLGFVSVLASLGGRGPSAPRDIDTVANWISEKGSRIEAMALDLDAYYPGYRPEIVLAVSDDETFLMVRDRVENGAPMAGSFIYSWAGGRRYYLGNPEGIQSIGRMAEAGRIAAPAVRRPVALPHAAPAQRRIARVASAGEIVRKKEKVSLGSLPRSEERPRSDLLAYAKRSGFKPVRSPSGTVYARTVSGESFLLVPEEGVLPAKATHFQLIRSDDPAVRDGGTRVETADELDAAIVAGNAPTP